MKSKTFKVREEKGAPEITLSMPSPETIEEFDSLVLAVPADVVSLAHRQAVVDLQGYLRRNWPEGVEGDDLVSVLQGNVDEWRYGAGGGGPRGPKVVSMPEGIELDPAVVEALAKQGVNIAG